MTTGPSSVDTGDDGWGSVPRDEGAAVASVENGEAIAIPSVAGLLRGLTAALAQARPVSREATRLARDVVRIVRFCAGGILLSTLLSHLAQVGPPVVHSASYAELIQYSPTTASVRSRTAGRPARGSDR